jgi:uncharacterized protein
MPDSAALGMVTQRGLERPSRRLSGSDWLQCGLSFFGVDHIVFASDPPFGRIDEAIEVIRQSSLSVADQEKVLSGNARKLLKI